MQTAPCSAARNVHPFPPAARDSQGVHVASAALPLKAATLLTSAMCFPWSPCETRRAKPVASRAPPPFSDASEQLLTARTGARKDTIDEKRTVAHNFEGTEDKGGWKGREPPPAIFKTVGPEFVRPLLRTFGAIGAICHLTLQPWRSQLVLPRRV